MKHGQSRTDTLRAANSAMCRLASSSVSARGKSRAGCRASGGTSSKSCSTRSIPIARSMCARSSDVSWVKSGTGLLGVLLSGKQLANFGRVLGPNFDHPPRFVRVVVDALGLIDQFTIDLDDVARDWGIQIRCRLDGFDHSELHTCLDVIAHFGELDVHDVAQLVLGK